MRPVPPERGPSGPPRRKTENTGKKIAPRNNISLEQYLEKVARFCQSDYGKMVRERFEDIHGTSELAMLAAPTAEELAQLRKAVAIMTPAEKQKAHELNDEQVQRIAADARIDPANLAIFINSYALQRRGT